MVKMRVLGFFFTRGVSLQHWVNAGLFDREVSLHHEHLNSGFFDNIYWFTYGTEDENLAKKLIADGRLSQKLCVVQSPKFFKLFSRFGPYVYSALIPFVHKEKIKKCDVIKTNQMKGAISALLSAFLYSKPIYVRTGYTLSSTSRVVNPKSSIRLIVNWIIEYFVFKNANISSVSSEHDLRYVQSCYKLKKNKLKVIVNYVDTEKFYPVSNKLLSKRIIFVGRLSKEKNLLSLITACKIIGIGLDLVGNGRELENLQKYAKMIDADIRHLGSYDNDLLPGILTKYNYFILPSLWEGKPKALLEAMSCGLVCIGNSTSGINEIIEDGINGFLSKDSSTESLVDAIRRAKKSDKKRVGDEARNLILKKYSLKSIINQEREIFLSLIC